MKARIRATGEIIKVKMHFPEFERPYFTMVDSDGVTRFTSEDLEPFEPNWQQVRIQAAIAIVQGWASTPQGLTKNCMKGAVELADALIAELQKEGGQHE